MHHRFAKLFTAASCLFVLGILPACGESSTTREQPLTPTSNQAKVVKVDAQGKLDPESWPLPENIPTENPEILEIGSKAPDFNLPGIDGKMHKLSDYDDADVLMLVFTCNHCPDAQLAEESIKKIVTDYKDKSFQLVAISPNNPLGIRPDELGFSVHGDSYSDMIKHAKDNAFNFPYLYDGATQETGRAYGAQSSPHCFIFDKDRVLRYQGRINNLKRASDELTETQARDAIEAIFAGKEVEVKTTRSFGCSTKWLYKMDSVAKDEERWKNKEVTIEPIDAAGVAALVKNDTEKLRLINVWATTCGPCVAEMPDLVMVNRNYQNRAFEMITISMDPADESDEALRLLQMNHVALGRTAERTIKDEGRTTNNYIYSEKDLDALAEALDAEWTGPIPHTILVAPGGEIIYRHTGEVDIDELRHAIVGHLGRYWQ